MPSVISNPPPQCAALFADTPQEIDKALELSSRLQFTLADLGYEFPRYPVPSGETMDSFLRAQTLKGALSRYGAQHEKAYRQIERELALIEKLKLPGYFLIVWDIVEFCRKQGILVQGRGSAANSAVCYSLGITAIDPVKMELLFERFLIRGAAANGPISISICPAATIASRPFSTSISAMENWARR